MTSMSPVFVTGPDRSGTTLMYSLLASHSRISMVRRTNMFRWFDVVFGDLSVPDNLERCLDVMLRYRRLDILSPDPERIRREFGKGERTYGRLFSLLHGHHAESVGKPRWGDKSLHEEHFAHRIFAEFPAARVIHMLRDPRDRHASVTRRYADRGKGLGAVTGRWMASTRRGEANLHDYPGRYLLLRYEDLASDPIPTLRRVCAFIDEEYEPSMLRMEGAPDRAEEGNSSFEKIGPGKISTRSIGRYRETLDDREIAFIQRVAGRAMRRHGYDPVPVSMPWHDDVRYHVLDLPVNLGRLVGWHLTDGRRERRPGGVPEHRLADPGAVTTGRAEAGG